MQLLWATNSLTGQPEILVGFASIYERNGDGIIDANEVSLRILANDVYSTIDEQGDIRHGGSRFRNFILATCGTQHGAGQSRRLPCIVSTAFRRWH